MTKRGAKINKNNAFLSCSISVGIAVNYSNALSEYMV